MKSNSIVRNSEVVQAVQQYASLTPQIEAQLNHKPIRSLSQEEAMSEVASVVQDILISSGLSNREEAQAASMVMIEMVLEQYRHFTSAEVRQAWMMYCADRLGIEYRSTSVLGVPLLGKVLQAYTVYHRRAKLDIRTALGKAHHAAQAPIVQARREEANRKTRQGWLNLIVEQYEQYVAGGEINLRVPHLNFLYAIGVFNDLPNREEELKKAKAKAQLVRRYVEFLRAGDDLGPLPKVYSAAKGKKKVEVETNDVVTGPLKVVAESFLGKSATVKEITQFFLLERIFQLAKEKGSDMAKMKSYLQGKYEIFEQGKFQRNV